MTNRVRYGEDFWRQMIGSQEQSALSVADFCEQHQLKTVTFYRWRKRLRERSLAGIDKRLTSARGDAARRANLATLERNSGHFVELMVDAAREFPQRASDSANSPPSLIEVSLAGGTLIRIHGYVEPDAIGQVVASIRDGSNALEGR
jgi:transposase-like protein